MYYFALNERIHKIFWKSRQKDVFYHWRWLVMIENYWSVLVKYNELWNKIKKALNIKFDSMPVYDEKLIKATIKEFNGVVNINFWGVKVPKEGVHHHTSIAWISTVSLIKIGKKNYLQVYLEQCKHKIKDIKILVLLAILYSQ